MSRSLTIRNACIQQAKLALKRNGFHSQRALAESVGYSLSTVGNFLRGKPVDFATFSELCDCLNLDWQKVSSGEELARDSLSLMPPVHETLSQPHAKIQDWGEALDVSQFYNRVAELDLLQTWIQQDPCRIVTLLGMGGVGKTSLAVKLARELQPQFDVVIFRSLRNAPTPQDLVMTVLSVLSPQLDIGKDWSVSRLLAQLLTEMRSSRCLLVLDNLESVLQDCDRTGNFRSGYELYGDLLRLIGETNHRSCLILTSRQKPVGLHRFEGENMSARCLQLQGLHLASGRKIFDGYGPYQASDDEWARLIQRYAGNPLALKIVASYIRDCFNHNISSFLQFSDIEPIIFDDIRELLDQQVRRLSALESTLMTWLAINRAPTSVLALQKDLIVPISPGEVLQTLTALKNRSLIESVGASYRLQPVLQEHITTQFIQDFSQSILDGHCDLLVQYPLMKAQSSVQVHQTQCKFLVQPLVEQLLRTLNHPDAVLEHLNQILIGLQGKAATETGYACANVLHIAKYLGLSVSGFDFSDLTVWQANLQGMKLQGTTFARSHFRDSTFSEILDEVKSIAFSPDGAKLAIADHDCKVMVWSVDTGQRLWEGREHTHPVNAVVFSPNGQWIASASADQTLRLWDMASGECLKTFEGHQLGVNALAFSPNSKMLVSGGQDHQVMLWDVDNGTCIDRLQGHQQSVMAVAFNATGSQIASGSADKTVKIWNLETRNCEQTLDAHHNWVVSVAFCPRTDCLASSSTDHSVRLWDSSTGECLKTLTGHRNWVLSLAFSPDGTRLVSGSGDQTLKVWDVQTGHCLHTLSGHGHAIFSVAFNPMGKIVVSGGLDQSIRFWDVTSGICLRTLEGYTNRVFTVAARQTTLASGSFDHRIRLWNAETGDLQQTLKGHTQSIYSLAFSPRDHLLASGSGDRTLKLWHVPSGRCVHTFSGHRRWVYSVAFSPDGEYLLSGSGDHTLKLWRVTTGQCIRTFRGHHTWVWSVAFAPQGNLIASGSGDRTLKIWDRHSGECLRTLKGHSDRVYAVAFSPDGTRLYSGSYDHTIKVWQTETGECLQTLSGHTHGVFSIAVHPNGATLVSGSQDQTLKIWDLASGQCLKTFQGHENEVRSVAIACSDNLASVDDIQLVSGSQDQTLRLWNFHQEACHLNLKVKPLYQDMDISDTQGLTPCQKKSLEYLGAIETFD